MIDLRSDTVTKPSKEMRQAMYDAEVGDDVYKEDPTANELEEYAADLLGKEAALFVPSGVMGNQICLNVHTQPGDEVICEWDAHIFHYESGTPSAISGIQLLPVKGERGIINADDAEPLIRPLSAYYMPRSKGIAVENTHNRAGGAVCPVEKILSLKKLTEKYNLFFHLDGARVWNAAQALTISEKEIAAPFDSISCCLSKGLGAPIGSVIAGKRDFIKECYRVRKAWGGGMRQVGVLAAAGLYALKHNRERLKEDHENAKIIAHAVAASGGADIDLSHVETNIVVFKPNKLKPADVIERCREKGLMISPSSPVTLRAVLHLDISRAEAEKAADILSQALAEE